MDREDAEDKIMNEVQPHLQQLHIDTDRMDKILQTQKPKTLFDLFLSYYQYEVPADKEWKQMVDKITPNELLKFEEVFDFHSVKFHTRKNELKNFMLQYGRFRGESPIKCFKLMENELAVINTRRRLGNVPLYQFINWVPEYGGLIAAKKKADAQQRAWMARERVKYLSGEKVFATDPNQPEYDSAPPRDHTHDGEDPADPEEDQNDQLPPLN